PPPRPRFRQWRRAAAPARHLHRRRTDRQPAAHALHHARCLSLHRPRAPAPPRLAGPAAGRRPGGRPDGGGPSLTRFGMKRSMFEKILSSSRTAGFGLATALVLGATGCAVGPNYHRPEVAVPQNFKEAAGWKPATPNDDAARSAWWEVFQDPVLNQLEGEILVSNQSLLQAAANYEEARQLARADHATLFPSLSAVGSYQRLRRSCGSSSVSTSRSTSAGTTQVLTPTSGSSGVLTTAQAGLQASWTPDFWGRIRRLSEADVAA